MQTNHFVCTKYWFTISIQIIAKKSWTKVFCQDTHVALSLDNVTNFKTWYVCVCVCVCVYVYVCACVCVCVSACYMCAYNIFMNLMASVILGICLLMHTGETPARHQWSFAQDWRWRVGVVGWWPSWSGRANWLTTRGLQIICNNNMMWNPTIENFNLHLNHQTDGEDGVFCTIVTQYGCLFKTLRGTTNRSLVLSFIFLCSKAAS